MMIQINRNKPTILNFSLEVHGSNQPPTARLVIPISETLAIVVNGDVDKSVITVEVPPIAEYYKLDESVIKNSKLEVIIDESLFIPWSGELGIKDTPVVNATVSESTKRTSKIKATIIPPVEEPEESIVEDIIETPVLEEEIVIEKPEKSEVKLFKGKKQTPITGGWK
jgi:hypothetical protein